MAARLAERFCSRLRYSNRVWYGWDGTSWNLERGVTLADQAAKAVSLELYAHAGGCDNKAERARLAKIAERAQSAAGVRAILDLASKLPALRVSPEAFDADDWALNVANGILDLRSGTLGPARSEALCTRLAPVTYDATATCPRFLRFLERVQPDPEIRRFLQTFAGYSLTGDVSAQVFFFLNGEGSNGKSVFVKVISALLGSYSVQLARAAILANEHGETAASLSALYATRGARLAWAPGASEERRLGRRTHKDLYGRKTLCKRS